MQTIAERLKSVRINKGWSQAQLAVAADVSTGTIGNIESGARKSKGSIPQIAKALGIRYEWLWNEDGDMLPQGIINRAMSCNNDANQPVAPADIARAATKTIASLDQSIDAMAWHLAQVDAGKRAALGALLVALTQNPEDPAIHASIKALMAPATFTQGLKKQA